MSRQFLHEALELATLLLVSCCLCSLLSGRLITGISYNDLSGNLVIEPSEVIADLDSTSELENAGQQVEPLEATLLASLSRLGDEEGRPSSRRRPEQVEEIYLLEDKDYPKSLFESYLGVGQVSGIATLPSGDVAIFHRADREWKSDTFNGKNFSLNKLNEAADNLIKNDTIMIIDRDHGGAVTTFGHNLFYMPHGIASDNNGNLWVTDVGRHQVMRLPTSMLQLNHQATTDSSTTTKYSSSSLANNNNNNNIKHRWLPGNLTRIWPDIILGEAFIPGRDQAHFCQPSEVEVSSNGRLIYVADGYCNKRIMVFTGTGKFLSSFGESLGFNVVHSLTLMEERNLICAADRENGRILCFRAGLDGDLESIGELVLKINYPLGKVYAIETISLNHLLVSSNQFGTSKYDLAALNPFTKELKQTWTSSDLLEPHSLARTKDGQYVYAADVSKGSYKKVFKFNIIERTI